MLVELELTTLQSAKTRFLVIGRNRSRVWIDYIDFSASGTREASEPVNNVRECIKRALQNAAEHHWLLGNCQVFLDAQTDKLDHAAGKCPQTSL